MNAAKKGKEWVQVGGELFCIYFESDQVCSLESVSLHLAKPWQIPTSEPFHELCLWFPIMNSSVLTLRTRYGECPIKLIIFFSSSGYNIFQHFLVLSHNWQNYRQHQRDCLHGNITYSDWVYCLICYVHSLRRIVHLLVPPLLLVCAEIFGKYVQY